MTNILAIIPARGGSKSIPHKNIAPCAGKPLVRWTLEAALASTRLNYIIISSDDTDILAQAPPGVLAQLRPLALAQDDTTTEAVIEYVLDGLEPVPDIIVLLQPTSPIRTGQQIDEAIRVLVAGEYDSILSVVPSHVFLWVGGPADPVPLYDHRFRKRRQELPPQYQENGSIYVFTRKCWETYHNRLGGKMGLCVMPEWCGPQVDTPYDLWLCGEIIERYNSR